MHITTYRTHLVTEQDSLIALLDAYVPKLQEQSILAITSKIVSLCEESTVEKSPNQRKELLIQQASDAFLSGPTSSQPIQLTLKSGRLIPSAGIDESNGNGKYILHPQNIQLSAASIWSYLKNRDTIESLGILITDSHVMPMHRGVTGIGIGWCGFNALYNYVGKLDCFGHPMQITCVNNLNALAAATVFCMGEGNEQTPFATITNAPKIEFQDHPPTQSDVEKLSISMDEDLFGPLLKNAQWIFNK